MYHQTFHGPSEGLTLQDQSRLLTFQENAVGLVALFLKHAFLDVLHSVNSAIQRCS